MIRIMGSRVPHVALAALLEASLVACSLADRPARPENVPEDAVRVLGGKTQWWIRCEYSSNVDTCQIFNAKGVTLRDEVFRPYDGGEPVREKDLKIDAQRSDVAFVWLENGRVLLPSSDFDRHKRLLDDIRRGASPRR